MKAIQVYTKVLLFVAGLGFTPVVASPGHQLQFILRNNNSPVSKATPSSGYAQYLVFADYPVNKWCVVREESFTLASIENGYVSLFVGAPFSVTTFGVNSQLINSTLSHWSLEEFASRKSAKAVQTYRCHASPEVAASAAGWSDESGFTINSLMQRKIRLDIEIASGQRIHQAFDMHWVPLALYAETSGSAERLSGTVALDGSAGVQNRLVATNAAGTANELKQLTAGAGVTITHSSGGIEISAAGAGGTVTNIATGAGLTGGPITTTGTIELAASGVTAATYGSASAVPAITVDAYGRITNAVSTPIELGAAAITSGTLPVARGGTGAATLTTGSLMVGNGTDPVLGLAAGASGNVIYGTGASTWASGTPDAAGLVDRTSAQTISGAKTLTSDLTLDNQRALALRETTGGGTDAVRLQAPAVLAGDVTLTLPATDGDPGQVLSTNGTGVLSWVNPSTGSVTNVTAAAPLASSGGATPEISIGAGSAAGQTLRWDGAAWSAARLALGDFASTGGTANQIMAINNAGNATEFKSITAGTGVSVTHSAGGIEISATGSGGTVTSVGVAVPAFMTSSGGPITASGDITLGFGPQANRFILAAPEDGSSAAPSFRNIRITDVRSTGGGNPAFFNVAGACTAGQMLTYNSVNDQLECAAYTIAANAVGTSQIADGAVTTPKIADANVTADKLATDSVITAKIQDAAVTTAKIADANVTTAKIADASITPAKMAAASAAGRLPIVNGTNTAFDWLSCAADQAITWDVTLGFICETNYTFGTGDLLVARQGAGAGQGAQIRLQSNSGTHSVVLKAPDGLAADLTLRFPATAGSSGDVLTTDGAGVLSWAPPATGGVSTVDTFDATSTANGLSISGSNIKLHAADGTNPGAVTTTAQTFAGDKTFSGAATFLATGTALSVTNNASIGGNLAIDTDVLFVDAATNQVGIGSASPSSALDVTGSVISRSHSTTSGSIDFNLANAITTSFDCSSNLSFSNLRNGGSYTLAVTSTATTQCNFNTSVTGADAATVSYRFAPANGVRVASSHTIYSFQRIGNIVYVSWITGF